ncbi:3'-5' exonuclease [Olleya sp. YS]|uniref:3'-5' exonuclease n=1 Tax=Olleya sp. YS TaxID=3028318 RepID=UPI002434424B|nr:3'-5' exonuclease [Olleya sp. YS]WGD35015.1 3'-5' exonuclease [Olleya sp. YS]
MPTTFAAIDFETAKGHHICSVGIVTFTDGEIVDEYHQLIQPPNNDYNWHNIQVHGITEADTRFAPNFKAVYPEIKKRISGITTVAHNEAFDRTVLLKTMKDYGISASDIMMPSRWECTLKLYRKKGYKPAKLDACCKVHNIALKHHDALSDARACGKLFVIAQFERLPLF